MKKFFAVCLAFLLVSVWGIRSGHAEVDWSDLGMVDIGVQPIDLAASVDGKLIFILSPGEIHVYSTSDNRMTNRIPVETGFDKITYSAREDLLILTAGASKKMKIIQVERIFKIDTTGHPVKGPVGAPVTIAVFDDYQ